MPGLTWSFITSGVVNVRSLRDLYNYGVSGPRDEKREDRKRMERILRKIYHRFPNEAERHLQVKHLRWFLEHGSAANTATTRYRHWCDIRFFCGLLEKPNWLAHLRGPWQYRNGIKPDKAELAKRHPGGRPPRKPSAQKLAENRAQQKPRIKSEAPRRRSKRRGRDEIYRDQIAAANPVSRA